MASSFRDLVVYQRAGALSDDVGRTVRRWPPIDLWTLGTQLIRASDSVPANIAEGAGRHSLREQVRFYLTARGSLHELQHWLVRADAVGLPLPPRALQRADEIGRMLNGLVTSARKRATSN